MNFSFSFVQRTLFVIEALLRSDVPDIYSHLDLALEELNSLTSSDHSSIKAKATKVRASSFTFKCFFHQLWGVNIHNSIPVYHITGIFMGFNFSQMVNLYTILRI